MMITLTGENPYEGMDDHKLKERLKNDLYERIYEFNCIYDKKWKQMVYRNLIHYDITEGIFSFHINFTHLEAVNKAYFSCVNKMKIY